MEYISVSRLSERWNVTPRYIQNLCRAGRLPGAVRMGKIWLLPEDTERPTDNRYKDAAKTEKSSAPQNEVCWSVIGASYRVPGTADEIIKSLADNQKAAELTKAQFAYLRGDIDTSKKLSKGLLDSSDDFEIKIGAAFLMGICAMYNGDINAWKNVRTLIENIPCADDGYKSRKELWLAIYGASVYDMSGYPDWFKRGCFDLLPPGYYPAAYVHYVKYIYICGDSVVKRQPLENRTFHNNLYLLPAVCEPLISQTALDKAIVSEIYMRLLCATSYHHAGNDKLATEHIERALALALPDKIIAPFAEQRLNLDSLIDDITKKFDNGVYNDMKNLNVRLMDGWSLIHNTVLNRSHTNELTSKELETARLAVFGLTNIEIADRMGISINSVKAYLQSAKDKTGVKKRSELARFV